MWDGNSIFNLPRKNQDNQGHIAPCSLSCAQDSSAPSPQHLALSSFVSLHFVGLRTDPALWCFREIFRRGVHVFLGVYVCACTHAHTHVHSSWMEVRKQLSGVISLISCLSQDPSQEASTVAIPLPTEPSCWPMSIFLLLFMLWVSQ